VNAAPSASESPKGPCHRTNVLKWDFRAGAIGGIPRRTLGQPEVCGLLVCALLGVSPHARPLHRPLHLQLPTEQDNLVFGMVSLKLGEVLSHQIRVKLHSQESMVFGVRQILTQILLPLLQPRDFRHIT